MFCSFTIMSSTVMARAHATPFAASAAPSSRAQRVAAMHDWHGVVLKRMQQAAVATAAAAVVLGGVAPAALARSTALDLPSCTKFQAAAGIEYCDVRVGSGPSPELGDQVETNYTARVAGSNKVFDGSRGFEFTLGQGEVIPGWEIGVLGGEGLPAIKQGGIRTIRLPPQLAYGEEGYGCLYGLSTSCRIPPNSSVVITFEYNGLGY